MRKGGKTMTREVQIKAHIYVEYQEGLTTDECIEKVIESINAIEGAVVYIQEINVEDF